MPSEGAVLTAVAIEAIGTAATFRAAVEEVAFTGRVVYIGYAKEPVSYETRLFVKKNWMFSAPETHNRGFRGRHQASGSADVPR